MHITRCCLNHIGDLLGSLGCAGWVPRLGGRFRLTSEGIKKKIYKIDFYPRSDSESEIRSIISPRSFSHELVGFGFGTRSTVAHSPVQCIIIRFL